MFLRSLKVNKIIGNSIYLGFAERVNPFKPQYVTQPLLFPRPSAFFSDHHLTFDKACCASSKQLEQSIKMETFVTIYR